ncbi:MAG: epimerase, partial [Gemmatimonadetes bacterium]|nr:epimerase [Gemmatimonadota bacterium]
MRLLILGGTEFVGRHFVEIAHERGHELTLFHRGKTNPGLFPDLDTRIGDRDGDLSALE